jgi:soluble lytic murein transglycosylase-like protein
VHKVFAAIVILFGSVVVASAAELAVLQNGFSIRHERHETIGDTTRLYTSASDDSFIEVPTAQITSYAADDTPAQAPAPEKKPDVQMIVNDAGQKHGLDPDFIASVVRAESSYNLNAVSPKGARGLMQLMPQTAEQLGVKDISDPASNVDGGTKYLRALLDQYHGNVPKALAAYNAGAHRVDQYHGVPPYAETRAYVRRIMADYNRKKTAAVKKPAPKKTTQVAESKPHSAAIAGSR